MHVYVAKITGPLKPAVYGQPGLNSRRDAIIFGGEGRQIYCSANCYYSNEENRSTSVTAGQRVQHFDHKRRQVDSVGWTSALQDA